MSDSIKKVEQIDDLSLQKADQPETINTNDSNSTDLNHESSSDKSSPNKTKKTVRFNDVKLFLFNRTQGFECIPSDDSLNSITLGMSFKHSYMQQFNKVDDYLKFKRLKHLTKLEEEKDKILSNEDSLYDLKILTCDDLIDEANFEDESRKILEIVSNRKDYENIELDLPINMDVFCPILNPIERRIKLVEAGVDESEIESSESIEIKTIRESREICGCKCTQMGLQCGVENEKCTCYSNGIGCQIDKTRYPCDCTVRKCKNPFGLKRFDQKAVSKHYRDVLSDNYTPNINDDEQKEIATKPKRKRKRNSGCYSLNIKKRKVKIAIKLIEDEKIESQI